MILTDEGLVPYEVQLRLNKGYFPWCRGEIALLKNIGTETTVPGYLVVWSSPDGISTPEPDSGLIQNPAGVALAAASPGEYTPVCYHGLVAAYASGMSLPLSYTPVVGLTQTRAFHFYGYFGIPLPEDDHYSLILGTAVVAGTFEESQGMLGWVIVNYMG